MMDRKDIDAFDKWANAEFPEPGPIPYGVFIAWQAALKYRQSEIDALIHVLAIERRIASQEAEKLRAFCEGLELNDIDRLLADGKVGDFRRLGERITQRGKKLKEELRRDKEQPYASNEEIDFRQVVERATQRTKEIKERLASIDAAEQVKKRLIAAFAANHGGRIEDAPGTRCPNGLTPDGPICPRCGGTRAPSGIDGGTWVHYHPDKCEEGE